MTYNYQEKPGILHPLQQDVLCELLSFIWDKTKTTENSADRVDIRLAMTKDQLVAVRNDCFCLYDFSLSYEYMLKA